MTATSTIENGCPKVDLAVRRVTAEALHAALADGGELAAYQTCGDRFAAFREYLAWEIGLVAQLERDRTANFRLIPVAR